MKAALARLCRRVLRRGGVDLIHCSDDPIVAEILAVRETLRVSPDLPAWKRDYLLSQLAARAHLQELLRRLAINLVIDVGANQGQFALGLRALGYRGRIVSFEPQTAQYAHLRTLTARDATLMGRIEGAMGEFRAAIDRGASPDDLAEKVTVLGGFFDDAEAALAPDAATEASTFLGAFTILLREGLEALLIVVAMIAFLRKAERGEALRYVHGGWVSAIIAGGITWAVATYAIGISGASRELTEGFGSLFAAVVLLSVGIWMHGKAQADQWQRYIREKMSRALSGGSGWFLFGLAFVVVYREVFETILFYAALSAQGDNGMLLAGAGSAIGLLSLIAWAMLRYSRKLPIAQFFRYSSWLMAVLTVVLAGKGVAALQEAGLINIAPLADVPRLSMLGVFPTWQSVLAQLLMAVAIAVGFAWNGRDRSRSGSGSVTLGSN